MRYLLLFDREAKSYVTIPSSSGGATHSTVGAPACTIRLLANNTTHERTSHIFSFCPSESFDDKFYKINK